MYKFQSPFFFVCGTDLITTTAQLSHLFFFSLSHVFVFFSSEPTPASLDRVPNAAAPNGDDPYDRAATQIRRRLLSHTHRVLTL